MSNATSRSDAFPSTAWASIRAVQDPGDPARLAELNRLIGAYWRPVFRFLRARGHPAARAEDLTQGFFLSLLEDDWIRTADQGRGRFRNFLLRILQRFVADQSPDRAGAQARFELGQLPLSALLTDDDRGYEPATAETPEVVFLREWVLALLGRALGSLRQWCGAERAVWYALFVARYYPDAGAKSPTVDALAQTHGLSHDQV